MMGQVSPANGTAAAGAGVSKPQSASPVSSTSSQKSSGKDYDFSSLTQGMFSKHWFAFHMTMPEMSYTA